MTVKAPYRVSQPSATQGTGAYSLGSAIGANRPFSAAYTDGDLIPVFSTDGTNDYEVGVYTLNSGVTPNTLTRTTVLLSSNGNAAVNWGPGTRNIGAWEAASANYTLTAAGNYVADISDWGNVIIHTGNGGNTFTLPALTAVPLGYAVCITHTGSSTFTIAVNGADAILGGLIAPVLTQGQFVQIIKHTSGWIIVGRSSNNSDTDAAGSFTTISASGVITSTVSTGTAPFTIASTTQVANLNASQLIGSTWAAPAAIGTGTPAAGTFTTVTANASVAIGGATIGSHALAASVNINGAAGANLTNSNTGAGAYTALYFGDSASATDGLLALVGSGNSAYGGAKSMLLGTNVATPILLMTAGAAQVRIIHTATPANTLDLTGGTAPIVGTSAGNLSFATAGTTRATLSDTTGVLTCSHGFNATNGILSGLAAGFGIDFSSNARLFNVDTTSPMTFYSNGAGGNPILQLLAAASSTNYITIASGANPTIGTQGGQLAVSSAGGRFQVLHVTNPTVQLSATGSGADLKNWDSVVISNNLAIQATNDGLSAATIGYQITRGSTYNIASHHFYTSTVAGTPIEGLEILNTGGANHLTIQSNTNPTISTSGGNLAITPALVCASTITCLGGATLLTTSSALTDGAGAGTGTITNAPTAGNPTKWIQINDNGTTRKIPTWT